MPLLFLDLDNTLLDRASAFRAWADQFLGRLGAPAEDLDWLVAMDADGLTSAWDVAEAIKTRYGLSEPVVSLKQAVHEGPVGYTRSDPLVGCALRIATNAGWVPVIVSNGDARVQETKIRRTGLDQLVAGWVISEEAGVSKPNPRIFEIAAHRARARLAGGWIVGDGPETDIAAAAELRLPSVWLHRGRSWTHQRFGPSRTADGVIGAVAMVLDEYRRDGGRPVPISPPVPGPVRPPAGRVPEGPGPVPPAAGRLPHGPGPLPPAGRVPVAPGPVPPVRGRTPLAARYR